MNNRHNAMILIVALSQQQEPRRDLEKFDEATAAAG